jgi:hypothetical protein
VTGVVLQAAVLGQATPEPAGIAPKPDECVVEPRKFQSPEGTPVAAAAGVLPGPASIADGEPASDEQGSAVNGLVLEALACRNAGDLRRAYALMSDRLIAEMLGGEAGPAPELLYLLENRSERLGRTERLELVAIDRIELLADGRIRATVTTRNVTTIFEDLILFVPNASGDGWLIDQSIVVARLPRAGTPIAQP